MQGLDIQSAYPYNQQFPLPMSTLGYATNNQYREFPPMMDDGRALTAAWQPEAVLNNKIIEDNGLKSNWEYRNFMTHNAKSIMNHNLRESCNDVGYFMRVHELASVQAQIQSPYRSMSKLDSTKPLGHESPSDLKKLYLTREELNERRTATTIVP
jgi:hypothetical protein